jgi:hypothetical protein
MLQRSRIRDKVDPVATAEEILAPFDIRAPGEIEIGLMAYEWGACVLTSETGSADARVVRAGDDAYLAIAKDAEGTVRSNFSIAHELAHVFLHEDVDALERIHAGRMLTAEDFKVEYQADRTASLVLVPTRLAAPLCVASPPTLDAVAELARIFDVSLTVAARRWAELAPTPCTWVEARRGHVRWTVRSAAFRGIAVGRRKLEEGTLAFDMIHARAAAGVRAHERAWGAGRAGCKIIEECVPLNDDGAVLAWLWHA